MQQSSLSYKLAVGAASTVQGVDTIAATSAVVADLVVNAGAADVSAPFSVAFASMQSIYMQATQPVTLKFGGTDEVQTVAITGVPTGGTFTLTFASQTTAAIAYNSTAAAALPLIAALSSVGTGNVAVTGGPLPGTPLSVTFKAAKGKANQAAMTFTSSLTGGTTPTVVIAEATAGVAPDKTISLAAGIPQYWSVNSMFANPFSANLATVYATNATGAQATVYLRALTN